MPTEKYLSTVPIHPEISKCVEYYYFQEILDPEYNQTYFYYPNLGSGYNVYLDAEVEINEEGRIIEGSRPGSNYCILTLSHKRRRYVKMTGTSRKLGIIFKPLGINHFITGKLSEIHEGTANNFDLFGPQILDMSQSIFTESSASERGKILEHLLLKQYRPFEENRIQFAIDLLLNQKTEYTAEGICQQLGINRRTLLRLFKDHIGYSFQEFKSLLKFRSALHQFMRLDKQKTTKLSHLAYDSGYYDQAHFIRHFKNLTGYNPAYIFESLEEKATNELIWTYEK